ncbi:PREDICTED: melanoma antigen recognized by T-cells 1 [Elephantulus edwardii]|uniref:melanoma antigen recognized by T-cells 1 n=1 Tax=Elephantulus edwardii TaxID=28737 RepID=UPI0003F07753|nr:PREDICTED: melanoma antigen recognized by T-cells 1 [Elephantulus edwardii]
MPRDDTYLVYGHMRRGHSHGSVTAEEAAGIGILTVILGVLLLVGCWYCRRRRGYRVLSDKSLHADGESALPEKSLCKEPARQDSKLPSQEHSRAPVVPNAPPAYEKLSPDQAPPPYSP